MSSPNPDTDRRKEPRFPSKGLADLLILDSGKSERLTARVANVSRSGFKLELDEPVEGGSQIELRLKEVIVSGVVTNCEPDGKGHYLAGILTAQVTDSPLRTRHLPDADMELYALGKSLSEAQREQYAGHLELCETCKNKVPEIAAAPPVKAGKASRRSTVEVKVK